MFGPGNLKIVKRSSNIKCQNLFKKKITELEKIISDQSRTIEQINETRLKTYTHGVVSGMLINTLIVCVLHRLTS